MNLKFIYSEKATKFCEIFTLHLTVLHTVKSKVKILQNFVAFLEYMNFKANLKMVPHKNVEIVYPIEVKMFMECLLMRFFMLAWGSLRAKIANAR